MRVKFELTVAPFHLWKVLTDPGSFVEQIKEDKKARQMAQLNDAAVAAGEAAKVAGEAAKAAVGWASNMMGNNKT